MHHKYHLNKLKNKIRVEMIRNLRCLNSPTSAARTASVAVASAAVAGAARGMTAVDAGKLPATGCEILLYWRKFCGFSIWNDAFVSMFIMSMKELGNVYDNVKISVSFKVFQ